MQSPDASSGHYTLRAYRNGWRYEIEARSFGDWYDVDAVLALLNSVLSDARSDLRYRALATSDQFASVVLASEQGLAAASKAGWLSFGQGGAAREQGEAFEDEVFRKIEAEGGAARRNVLVPTP
jgi:hypothetical protein